MTHTVIAYRTSLRKKCPYLEFFWSECGKIRTRKTPETESFHAVPGNTTVTKI